MSKLYNRVFTGFYEHRKTRQLRRILGTDALWIPPRLWAFAAEHEPAGDFDGYSPEDIAEAISYKGDASSMLQALKKVGFMDDDPLRIHNGEAHNRYHKMFSERAKKAANARWNGKDGDTPSPRQRQGHRQGTKSKHAPSIPHDASLVNCEDWQLAKELKAAKVEYREAKEASKPDKDYIKAIGNRIGALKAEIIRRNLPEQPKQHEAEREATRKAEGDKDAKAASKAVPGYEELVDGMRAEVNTP